MASTEDDSDDVLVGLHHQARFLGLAVCGGFRVGCEFQGFPETPRPLN